MPYLSVKGAEHYYEWITSSEHAEPSGKPVMVFVHGWGGSCSYWQSTAQALSDSFDCLLYDMRGFGRSRGTPGHTSVTQARTQDQSQSTATSTPEAIAETTAVESQVLSAAPTTAAKLSYEMESYAEDLAGLLDGLGLDRVYVNAHSMGASVATFFLNLYPERVERAILTCSGIFEYDEKAFGAFHKFGGYVVKFRPRWLYKLPFVDRLFMARFLHRSLPGSISRAFLEDFLVADYQAALGTIFTSVSKKAAEIMPKEFARVQVPTLLVAGEHDIIIPAAMGQQAADLNDQIEFALIADTAHFPMLEDPDTYLQRVREFLFRTA